MALRRGPEGREPAAEGGFDVISLVLVEDHEALRRGMELLLGRRGHVIAGAVGTGTEAYELIGRTRPDVAVIDLGLTDESGADLIRRLLVRDPGLRSLLYTGTGDLEAIAGALDCGACGFALKAGSPEELTHAIGAVASGKTYMDPRLDSVVLARATTDRVRVLSPREREILDLLAEGLTGAQIAKRLFLSPETVRTHVRNAMEKLEAQTRVHAVALALRRREIEPAPPDGPSGGS